MAMIQHAGLHVEHVARRFGSTVVLQDVTLEAPPGRITALIGQNGAGKTTLFRILMGLTAPDAGSATLDGKDLFALPLHRKAEAGLGYLPQECASFPELTVRQNLLALLELFPLATADRRARLDELLALTHITSLADRRFDRLSAGEQRRLEIAKAFVAHPRILLLDEPFSGLDPCIVEDIEVILHRLTDQGVGILITDHNAHSIVKAAAYAFLLVNGGILCEGTPDTLLQQPEARRLYFGEAFSCQ